MKKRFFAAVTTIILLLPFVPIEAFAAGGYSQYGFTEVKTQKEPEGDYHLLRHSTGAQVVWLDDGAEERNFTAGFRTPPEDSKGANHVLEHALLCGSEQYPVHDLMHVLQNTSVADELNAYTSDDYTCYVIRTRNETDFYNLSDVYMSSILFPLIRTDENIFRQQGIRLEYADGKAQYNGIVFSELKLRSLDSESNSLEYVNDQLWSTLYKGGTPSLSAGGAIPDIFDLTYADVMRVYNTYYKPSNMLIYISGKQDINRTLSLFNRYLSKADQGTAPEITFRNQPVTPTQTVQEYNITADTKTVDIGFMAAGPSVLDMKQSEAWGVLASYVQQQLREAYPDADAYVTGGISGGINNVGPILCGISAEQRNEAVQAFRSILDTAAQSGIPSDRYNKLIDEQAKAQQFGREEIFMGFAYSGDPFACVGRDSVMEALRSDSSIIQTLAAQWRDTPDQVIIIAGNGGAKPSIPEPKLTAGQLEQVKKDTEAFHEWVSTPSTPEALASLPSLSASDLSGAAYEKQQAGETTNEASWYRTIDETAEDISYSLYFPVAVREADASAWCLLCEFLNDCTREQRVTFGLISGEKQSQPDTLAPRLFIGGSAEPGRAGESVQTCTALLKNPPLNDTSALRAFLTKRKSALRTIYLDPYATEYCMHLLAGGQSDRFTCAVPAGFNISSLSYKAFIDAAADAPEQDVALLERLRGLLSSALKRGGVIAGFSGSETDYTAFQAAAKPFLASLPAGDGAASCEFLPGGWPNALIVSSGSQDSTHVMITGYLNGEGDPAALAVLGQIITSKYLLPELRDKRGVYGANGRFDNKSMVFSCAGGLQADEAVAVYKGAGDWLRRLSLTEQELNSYKIGAIKEFDESAQWSVNDAASLAIEGKTQADFNREREAILAVTIDDIKGCADLLDRLTAQNHVVAQVTKQVESGIKFPFTARVNADTGAITPLLRQDIAESSDKTPLTRGEMAVLLADSLIDQNPAEHPELARFTDVTPGGEQSGALAKLYDRGLLGGYEDGTFRPAQTITRAEFCKIASALSTGGGSNTAAVFSDVPTDHWAHGVISQMAAQGILKGDGTGKFNPNHPVTRRDATLILRRLAGIAA